MQLKVSFEVVEQATLPTQNSQIRVPGIDEGHFVVPDDGPRIVSNCHCNVNRLTSTPVHFFFTEPHVVDFFERHLISIGNMNNFICECVETNRFSSLWLVDVVGLLCGARHFSAIIDRSF